MIWVSESYFKTAPTNIDEYKKSKLLNLQQENMRPKRNREINDQIIDEKYQHNKTDDKNLMKERLDQDNWQEENN